MLTTACGSASTVRDGPTVDLAPRMRSGVRYELLHRELTLPGRPNIVRAFACDEGREGCGRTIVHQWDLEGDDLLRLIEELPAIAVSICQYLSHRLQDLNTRLQSAEAHEKGGRT